MYKLNNKTPSAKNIELSTGIAVKNPRFCLMWICMSQIPVTGLDWHIQGRLHRLSSKSRNLEIPLFMLNAFNFPGQRAPLPSYKGPSGLQSAKGCTTKWPGSSWCDHAKDPETHKSTSWFESDGTASQIIVNFEKALLDRLPFHVS